MLRMSYNGYFYDQAIIRLHSQQARAGNVNRSPDKLLSLMKDEFDVSKEFKDDYAFRHDVTDIQIAISKHYGH